MPPRRSARASSSSRLFDGSSEAGGPLDSVPPQSVLLHTAVGRGMSPGPAKYSSSYGSPPTVAPTRHNVARQRYNFASALSHVVDAVEQDNENDARERAAREAEQQAAQEAAQQAAQQPAQQPAQQEIPATRRRAQAASRRRQDASRPPDDLGGSVDIVRERDGISPTPSASASAASAEPGTPAAAAHDFAEEESLFAEAQILTPVLPARTSGDGVVAKTSNFLHNLLNSARRISSSPAAHEDAADEAIRQAYPQFHFIRPRPDYGRPHADANGATAGVGRTDRASAEAAAAAAATATPKATRTGAKSVKLRIATPGPGVGARRRRGVVQLSRDSEQDELAGDGDERESELEPEPEKEPAPAVENEKTAAQSHFGRRRSARTQSQPQPRPQPAQGAEPQHPPPPPPSSAPSPPPLEPSRRVFLWDVGQLTRAFAMGITLLVLSTIAVRVFVISTAPAELYDGYRVDNRLRWYGSDWRSNLRQFVPFALVHPLGAISDEEFARMNGLLLSHANEVAQLQHTDRLHGAALDRINRILPAMVHMELDQRGRPVVTQEFWHALKDTIEADRDIFTLLWNKDGSVAVSDLQWTALQRQLQASGLLPDPDTKALSVADVEEVVEATLSKSWESWLRQNQNKVRDILGSIAPPPPPPPPSPPPGADDLLFDRLSDDQTVKLAQKIASSTAAKEVLVPRQDFLQILQNAFVEHRLEIRGELANLEARVVDIARAAAAAVSSSPRASSSPSSPSAPTPAGPAMDQRAIKTLVDQLVRKGISDAQLEAMARGKIKAHWHDNLVNQVNFFSRNTGAVFNQHFSSPAYEPVRPPFWKRHVGDGSGRDADTVARPVPGSQRGSVVLESWEQDGDCWCAAARGGSVGSAAAKTAKATKNGSAGPAEFAVKLGLRIVPQHVVVEHIHPSATLDPGAMPRDLEVWIQVTDYAQQRPLQDWSLSQFPDTDDQHPLFGWGFVKVGAFTFEARQQAGSGGEVQVFRLSPELEVLDAVTDHVLVRAVSNYGSKDHTCFYRVRLFGELRPDVVD